MEKAKVGARVIRAPRPASKAAGTYVIAIARWVSLSVFPARPCAQLRRPREELSMFNTGHRSRKTNIFVQSQLSNTTGAVHSSLALSPCGSPHFDGSRSGLPRIVRKSLYTAV